MEGIQIIHKILEQYKCENINFDVYIVADAQNKTASESDPRISHADESEFFSRMEFAEIASALFNVFGFANNLQAVKPWPIVILVTPVFCLNNLFYAFCGAQR